jgi:hypothetical protein
MSASAVILARVLMAARAADREFAACSAATMTSGCSHPVDFFFGVQ